MATKSTDILAEHWHDDEGIRPPKVDRAAIAEEHRHAERSAAREAVQELALAPLVDKIAYGLARGLVVAMKELENHIASETRKVGDSVGRRLDTLQASVQELTDAVSEQRTVSASLHDHCRQLDALTASLQETGTRHAAEIETLRGNATDFSVAVTGRIDLLSKESGVQQEDIAAIKSSLGDFCGRVDGVVERLDKQAEALRSMYATYAQRESELEQLVDGLARLRAYPTPKSMNAL